MKSNDGKKFDGKIKVVFFLFSITELGHLFEKQLK